MKARLLLIIMAVVEFLAGLAVIIFPSISVEFLLGSPLASASGAIVARVAGAALITLAVVCWMSRNDKGSLSATALITGMLLYNITVAAILTYSGFTVHLSIVLVLAIITHLGLATWCVFVLQYVRRNRR